MYFKCLIENIEWESVVDDCYIVVGVYYWLFIVKVFNWLLLIYYFINYYNKIKFIYYNIFLKNLV